MQVRALIKPRFYSHPIANVNSSDRKLCDWPGNWVPSGRHYYLGVWMRAFTSNGDVR